MSLGVSFFTATYILIGMVVARRAHRLAKTVAEVPVEGTHIAPDLGSTDPSGYVTDALGWVRENVRPEPAFCGSPFDAQVADRGVRP